MRDQLAMFTTRTGRDGVPTLRPNHPARWSDPDSSHVAITRLRRSGGLTRQRRMVLALLARMTQAVSAKELAAGDTALYHLLARRLPELKAAGYAEATDALPAQVWCITDAGKAALGGPR